MKQPAELLRRLQLIQVRSRVCGMTDVALKLDLMIATVEYLLDIENPATEAIHNLTQITPEEVEVLKVAEGIYDFYAKCVRQANEEQT